MVGSFCKVLFGILAILAVHSDAVDCYYKPDNTGIVADMAKGDRKTFSGIELNIDQGKNCSGYCAHIIGSVVNQGIVQNAELAGCQKDIKPYNDTDEALELFIVINVNWMFVIDEVEKAMAVEFSGLICNRDNCNADSHQNYKTLMNIQKVVNEGVQQLNGTRSTNLQCRNNGTMTDCPGACLIQGSYRSEDECIPKVDPTTYGMFVLGASNSGVLVNVTCNIQDCYSKGVTVYETTRTKVDAIMQKDRGTDSEGTNSEGTDSEGTDSEGTDSEGTDSEGTDSEGTDSAEEENSQVSNSTSVDNSSGNSVFFNGLFPPLSIIISILNL